jgi:hypothetical protein
MDGTCRRYNDVEPAAQTRSLRTNHEWHTYVKYFAANFQLQIYLGTRGAAAHAGACRKGARQNQMTSTASNRSLKKRRRRARQSVERFTPWSNYEPNLKVRVLACQQKNAGF